MSDELFGERRRALEEAFFRNQDAERLAEMRAKKQSEHMKVALRETAGITNERNFTPQVNGVARGTAYERAIGRKPERGIQRWRGEIGTLTAIGHPHTLPVSGGFRMQLARWRLWPRCTAGVAVVALLIAGAASWGCGAGSGGGGFASLLKDLPADADEASYIVLTDFTRAPGVGSESVVKIDETTRGILGDDIADLAATGWYFGEILGYSQYLKPGCEILSVIKIDCSGLEQLAYVAAADGPPFQYDVVRGGFSGSAVKSALTSCDGCPEARRRSHKGTDYFTWADDPAAVNTKRRLAPPTFDALGRGGVLAIADGVAYRTLSESNMRKLLEVRAGAKSLAKNDAFAAVAKQLDDLGTATALITARGQTADSLDFSAYGSLNPQQRAEIIALAKAPTALRPYQVMGIGQGQNADGPFLAIVLYHEAKGDASENATRAKERIAKGESLLTGKPWAETFTSVEMKSSGHVLQIILKGPGVAAGPAFWFRQDPLLFYE